MSQDARCGTSAIHSARAVLVAPGNDRKAAIRDLRGRLGNWLSWVALRPRVVKGGKSAGECGAATAGRRRAIACPLRGPRACPGTSRPRAERDLVVERLPYRRFGRYSAPFGGGSDANNVEGSHGHLDRPGGWHAECGNGEVSLRGGLQVL
jgi:hypothetical protein